MLLLFLCDGTVSMLA